MPKPKQSPPTKQDQKSYSKTGDEPSPISGWRNRIVNAKLNDANFRVKVVCLEVAGSEQDRIYLSKFEAFAAEEKRFVVKIICKTETIFMISQLGNDAKVRDENNKVFEEAAAFLREKKDIPAEYMALVIKYLIVKLKEEYLFIKRQKLDVAEGCRRESLIMERPVEVRGTVFQKSAASTQTKPEKNKGPKEFAPANKPSRSDNDENLGDFDEEKKYHTQLRERGEEWRDKEYVDDYPIDGPHLYIAVSGFEDPHLALSLVKVGVPIVAVVQIRIDVINVRIPSSLTRAAKRGASQSQLLIDDSKKFWEQLQLLRIMPSTAPYLKDTAFIVFSPPYWETEDLTGDVEKIYDEVCFLMYDTQDLARQHQNFLDNMSVIHVPDDVDESKEHHSSFQYYSRLIEGIPLECCPIYSVLDNMLHAVVKCRYSVDSETTDSHVDDKTPKVSVVSKENEKEAKAESIVNDIFDNLCQADNDKKTYRVTYGEEFERFKDLIVISYGDIVKYFTFHLGNMNLDQIVTGMLVGMPVNNLWLKEDAPIPEMETKISLHVNVLLSCFERADVETSELVRLLNILACRKLYNNRSSLRKEHDSPETLTEFKKTYLKRTILAEPITRAPSVIMSMSPSSTSPSFPSIIRSDNLSTLSPNQDDVETSRVKLLFDCPDISELVSSAEIAAEVPINHLMDDYEYFEDFRGTAGFQIIMDAFNKYNCLDYKYCEVTDSIVMMFFNSHNREGLARDMWRNHVPTAVCLQDFFDYVLDEHYEWIQAQDVLYYEALALMTRSMYSKHMFEQYEHSCLQETDVEMDMMLDGSIKHQQMVALEATTQVTSSDNNPSRPSSGPREGRKTTPRKTKQKHPKKEEYTQKVFSGYMLGDRRVEICGKDSTYFSKDGSKINTMYYLVIPLNYEWIIMNMVPGNGNNEFWFQRVIGEHAAIPENAELSENFRITTRDQVMYNVKKVNYRVLLTKSASEEEDPMTAVPSMPIPMVPTSPTFKSGTETPTEIYEAAFYHTLYVTWPNGLLIETVHEENSPLLSHIRLSYQTDIPGIDEEMRCYTLKGEAIIFRKAGNIEVLCPDGTYFNITKCGQRPVVVPPPAEDSGVDADGKKIKKDKKEDKGKGDKKGKEEKQEKKAKEDKQDKKGKVSPGKAKSSGSTHEMIRHHVEVPIETEFGIDEFEMLDTFGLKQRCYDQKFHKIEKLLIKTATDYCLGEVFMRRTDGTHYLLNKNGSYVSTYPDGTRIISDCFEEDQAIYPEWTEEEKAYFETIGLDMVEVETIGSDRSTITDGTAYEHSRYTKRPKGPDDSYVSIYIVYTIEHKNYARVTINNYEGKVTLDSPNGSTVVVDDSNHYDMKLDEVTTAKFDGMDLFISYEACEQCHAFTTCDVKVSYDEACSVDLVYRHWLRMKDSYLKRIVVNEEGDITLLDEESWSDGGASPVGPVSEEEVAAGEGEERIEGSYKSDSVTLHGKCRDVYTAKTMKFFVLRRDLTCSELVHRNLIEDYRKKCLWQPWCHIDTYDTFGDHRRLISILSPLNVTETEKWLMESRLCGKPSQLKYKDLKEDTCKKGFYHWMRPHGGFQAHPIEPDAVLPPRLPQAFILRTLELQWTEEERALMKGAKELIQAILKYRKVMESDCETILNLPICDPRTRDEMEIDRKVQLLGMQLYRKLKERLNLDLHNRMKRDITTKPLPLPEEAPVEGEEDTVDHTEDELRMLEEVVPTNENLARYWRRRADELKEEEFYRYLLRQGSVPPYFRNILGGAIWWEVNAAAGDAVTRAEDARMRCLCAEDTSRTATSPTPPPSGDDALATPYVDTRSGGG